jgi:hypothetical protein
LIAIIDWCDQPYGHNQKKDFIIEIPPHHYVFLPSAIDTPSIAFFNFSLTSKLKKIKINKYA